MKKKRFLTALISAGVFGALGACETLQPVTYACSDLVSAPATGSRISLAAETGQTSIVRLNGVEATCQDDGDEVEVALAIGLKLTRSLADNADPALLEVPFVAARIDAAEKVASHKSFSYRMAFAKNNDILYPLMREKINIPKGGRLVITLVPERIEIN